MSRIPKQIVEFKSLLGLVQRPEDPTRPAFLSAEAGPKKARSLWRFIRYDLDVRQAEKEYRDLVNTPGIEVIKEIPQGNPRSGLFLLIKYLVTEEDAKRPEPVDDVEDLWPT